MKTYRYYINHYQFGFVTDLLLADNDEEAEKLYNKILDDFGGTSQGMEEIKPRNYRLTIETVNGDGSETFIADSMYNADIEARKRYDLAIEKYGATNYYLTEIKEKNEQ